jgi:hypothetical protein
MGHKWIYNLKYLIFEPGETFISRHILHQHCYTCPISLPVRQNPQHMSFDYCLSQFRTSFHHLRLSNVLERRQPCAHKVKDTEKTKGEKTRKT